MHQLDPISVAIQNGHTRPRPEPERITDVFNPAERVREGLSGTAEVGGQLIIGVGGSTSTGVIRDASGLTCTVHTMCVMGGPRIGAGTTATATGATGSFEPGDVSYSIAGEEAWIFTRADLGIANTGSVSASAGTIFGADFGGAIKMCRTEVSNTCWNEGEK